jgi:hypothetical protein
MIPIISFTTSRPLWMAMSSFFSSLSAASPSADFGFPQCALPDLLHVGKAGGIILTDNQDPLVQVSDQRVHCFFFFVIFFVLCTVFHTLLLLQ